MCGRYAIFGPVSVSREQRAAAEQLGLDLEASLDPREPMYNVAPTQSPPILGRAGDGFTIKATRWGLVPSWAKDEKIGSRLINARVETVTEKPSFRSAFKKRRCLAPASGYFEWKGGAGAKQPYFIHDPDGRLLMFAALWEGWKSSADAEWLHTFTLITGAPGKLSGDIHDRQPVIMPPDTWEDWLTAPPDVARHLLERVTEAALTYHPVTKAVGSPKNKGAELIAPIEI